MSRLTLALTFFSACVGSAGGQGSKKDEVPKFRDKSAAVWAAELADKDVRVRREAITLLAIPINRSGPNQELTKVLLPHVIDRLTDDDPVVCHQAALTWVYLNHDAAIREQDAQILTAVLLDGLDDPSPDIRGRSASYLVKVNRDAKTVLAPLLKRLDDPNEEVRRAAASALGYVEPGTGIVAPLTAALKDKSDRVRAAAAASLGQVGGPARAAVPNLIAAIKDGDRWVRHSAVHALGDIRTDPDRSIPALIEALKDTTIEESAAVSLRKYGPAARPAVPQRVKRPSRMTSIPAITPWKR